MQLARLRLGVALWLQGSSPEALHVDPCVVAPAHRVCTVQQLRRCL